MDTLTSGIERRIAGWGGRAVVVRHDPATESWIFIALHDDTLGKPVGGTRIKPYETPEQGLEDAQRLAEGMTHKWAAIDLPFGGGKAVLALSRRIEAEERLELLRHYARLLNTLGGTFSTGQDLGTSPADMLELLRITPHVHGFDADSGAMVDPGPYTALGVFSGIRAAAAHGLGADDLAGCRVLVQGYGDVGRPLARLLADAGARLLVSDQDEARAREAAETLGAETVPPASVYETACDIYTPCAVGATLNQATVPRLACRVVAGSANNQLAVREDADALHARGILYAPDYVINAGGALAFGLRSLGETEDGVLREKVQGLGGTLTGIFAEAAERDESPLAASRRRVERVLARRRGA